MRTFLVLIALAGAAAPLVAEQGAPRLGGANGPPPAPPAPGRPVPVLSDGTVDLSGVWTDGGSTPIERLLKPGELKSLMLPWFDVTFTARLATPDSEILEYFCVENNQYGLPGGIANPASDGR